MAYLVYRFFKLPVGGVGTVVGGVGTVVGTGVGTLSDVIFSTKAVRFLIIEHTERVINQKQLMLVLFADMFTR